jgi:hypothetical protein
MCMELSRQRCIMATAPHTCPVIVPDLRLTALVRAYDLTRKLTAFKEVHPLHLQDVLSYVEKVSIRGLTGSRKYPEHFGSRARELVGQNLVPLTETTLHC